MKHTAWLLCFGAIACVVIPGAALATVGATGISAAARGFDVNDVSWLFPQRSTGLPYPSIKADEVVPSRLLAEINEEFLAENYQSLLTASPFPTTPEERKIRADQFRQTFDRANWYVVSARYDACAPSPDKQVVHALQAAGTIPGCLQQLRFVVQPVVESSAQPGFFFDFDAAVHVIYTLDVGEIRFRSPFIAGLYSLKIMAATSGAPTAGVPLQVHPTLAEEALVENSLGLYGWTLRRLLTSVSPQKLSNLAAFSLMVGDQAVQAAGDGLWSFKGGSVGRRDRSGVCRRTNEPAGAPCFIEEPVPVLGASKSRVDIFCNRGGCGINPELTQPGNAGGVVGLSVPPADEVARILHNLDDPFPNHIFNQDCASCHVTTSVMQRRGVGDTATRRPSPVKISGYLDGILWNTRSVWNFRNFGYFNGPTASTRTALESAFVAVELNKALGLPNPATCGNRDLSEPAVEAAVWSCYRQGRSDCCL